MGAIAAAHNKQDLFSHHRKLFGLIWLLHFRGFIFCHINLWLDADWGMKRTHATFLADKLGRQPEVRVLLCFDLSSITVIKPSLRISFSAF